MTSVRQRIFRIAGFLLGAFLCCMGLFIVFRPEVRGWLRVAVSLWMVGLGVFLIRFGLTGRPVFEIR